MYQATDLFLLFLLCQLIFPSSSSLHKTRSNVRKTKTLEVRETKLGSQGVVVTVENHSQYTLAGARAYITGEGSEFVQFAPERKVKPGKREEYVFPCQNCLDSSGVLSWTVYTEDAGSPVWEVEEEDLANRLHVMWSVECDQTQDSSVKLWIQNHARLVNYRNKWSPKRDRSEKFLSQFLAGTLGHFDSDRHKRSNLLVNLSVETGTACSLIARLQVLSLSRSSPTTTISPTSSTTNSSSTSSSSTSPTPKYSPDPFPDKLIGADDRKAGLNFLIPTVMVAALVLMIVISAVFKTYRKKKQSKLEKMRVYRSVSYGGKNEEIGFDIGKIEFNEDEFEDLFLKNQEPKQILKYKKKMDK